MTFRKGAASVIADGYLVAGILTDEMLDFLTGYGIILQLCDDLQDLQIDRIAEHRTIFGITGKKQLPLLTKRLILLSLEVFQKIDIKIPFPVELGEILHRSVYCLVLDAVYIHRLEFPFCFIKKLSSTCPIGLDFKYKDIKKYLQKKMQVFYP